MEFSIFGLLGSLFASGMMLIFTVGMYLIQAITIYKIAEKANVGNRWIAFIPLLQFILILHIIDISALWILLVLIPLVNIIFGIYVIAKLLQAFDLPLWLVVICILIPFAYQLLLLYLAFSADARYVISNRYA